jgi:lipopolysaccharide export system protein LptA
MRRLLLALLLLPGPALAQAIDFSKGGPIEVTSRDGMEWRQNEQQVIAQGSARAVRGDVTVTGDRLTARYRRKAAPSGTAQAAPTVSAAGATPAAATPGAPGPDGADNGSGNNEIYRLEADGHVHIFTPTDLAVGDHAVYDIDQAVLLMTGGDMKLTTPQQVLTARDTMEYWSQKHMAVGRGLATVTTADGRRLAGDILVGYTTPPDAPATPSTPPAPAAKPAAPGADPLASSGKLQRVEGFGHVEVRTATETIRGDRGVYVADTGIARLAGDVHITRGQSQLNGDEAIVNMRTGISTLSRNPGKRVEGLVVPNDATGGGTDAKKPPANDASPKAPSPKAPLP